MDMTARISAAVTRFASGDQGQAANAVEDFSDLIHGRKFAAVQIATHPGLLDAVITALEKPATAFNATNLLETLCRFGASTAVAETRPQLLPVLKELLHYDPPQRPVTTQSPKLPDDPT